MRACHADVSCRRPDDVVKCTGGETEKGNMGEARRGVQSVDNGVRPHHATPTASTAYSDPPYLLLPFRQKFGCNAVQISNLDPKASPPSPRLIRSDAPNSTYDPSEHNLRRNVCHGPTFRSSMPASTCANGGAGSSESARGTVGTGGSHEIEWSTPAS